MNNKNKGFTLTELLAVLVILVVIGLLAIVTVKDVLNKTNDVIDKDTEKQIINAAEKWAIENSDKFDDTEAIKMQVGLDVAFVLDFSGSMGFTSNYVSSNGKRISRYQAMIEALDSSLMVLNPENSINRVAIISYGKNVNTILPLDIYTTKSEKFIKWTPKINSSGDFGIISFPSLYNSHGTRITKSITMSNQVTYTQGGIYGGANVLLNSSDISKRIPVLILFTDGEPTAYYYSDRFSATCSTCNGSWNLNAATAMVRAGVKSKNNVQSYYNNNQMLFYTIGLGITEGSPGELVLNPTKENIEKYTYNSNRRNLANYLKTHDGSDAYSYATKSFVGSFNAEELKKVFSIISTEVIEATKVTQMCVTVEDLYKEGYLAKKDFKLNDGTMASEYVLINMNEATNQFVYSLAKTDEQKNACKELLKK